MTDSAHTHISEELPRLLSGEASRDEVLVAAEHLRGCVDCQHELISAVVAHSSLTSARRFAPDVVTRPNDSNLADATDAADRGDTGDIAAVAQFPRHATPEVTDRAEPVEHPALPDLSAVFEQVRREAADPRLAPSDAAPVAPRAARRTSTRTRWLAAAAAAVVIAGGGIAVYETMSGSNSSTDTGRSVALQPYGIGKVGAQARINDGTITLDASALPKLAGRSYEVWLTSDDRTRLQPIGWIGSNGQARISVPADVMAHYSDLEVSVQNPKLKKYAFSGTSVLRGALS